MAPKPRKERTKWTEEEEAALMQGVQKFGKSKWTPIKNSEEFRSALHRRSPQEMKDKWRNIELSMAKQGNEALQVNEALHHIQSAAEMIGKLKDCDIIMGTQATEALGLLNSAGDKIVLKAVPEEKIVVKAVSEDKRGLDLLCSAAIAVADGNVASKGEDITENVPLAQQRSALRITDHILEAFWNLEARREYSSKEIASVLRLSVDDEQLRSALHGLILDGTLEEANGLYKLNFDNFGIEEIENAIKRKGKVLENEIGELTKLREDIWNICPYAINPQYVV